MIFFLKKIKNSIYNFLSVNQIVFLILYLRFGNSKRLEKRKIKFLDYIFVVPDSASFIHQFKEIFVDKIYEFNSIEKQPIIYDCGANVGTSVLYFKKRYPNATIKAFEPDKKIFSYISNNLLANNIKDVVLENKAIWIDDKGVNFSSDGADGGSILSSNNPTVVPSVRLRDLLAKEKKVDMLKIDIEGAETQVLQDCADVLNLVDNIFVEYHSWNSESQQLNVLLSVLTSAGFRYYIKTLGDRREPFINTGKGLAMDLQLNIFAYKHE